MTDEASREPARDPQDLERLLIARQWVGDVDGMAALFEPHAVVDSGEGPIDSRPGRHPGALCGNLRDGSKICSGKSESGRYQRGFGARPRRAFPMAA